MRRGGWWGWDGGGVGHGWGGVGGGWVRLGCGGGVGDPEVAPGGPQGPLDAFRVVKTQFGPTFPEEIPLSGPSWSPFFAYVYAKTASEMAQKVEFPLET